MGVRRESVRLELDDAGFSTGMARAAGHAALLDKTLDDLDGSSVRLHKSLPAVDDDVEGLGKSTEKTTRTTKEYSLEMAIAEERSSRFRKSLRDQAKALVDVESGLRGAVDGADDLDNSSRRADSSINQLTGRLRLAADAAILIGPGALSAAAVGVPAITGLASSLGFAAIGMASLVVASQGVGAALGAVNAAALEPTAENLEKARVAMSKLGPEAQAFVTRFQDLRPVLGDIRDAAARGWFPGLTESLDSFEKVAPRVASLFEKIGAAGGNLVADGAEALAGPEWAEFLTFVEDNAPQALDELGRTVGNVIKGLANLWQAFDPLNDDFSSWLLDQARAFENWSDGLSTNAGFQQFVAYIRTNGPRVAAAFAAVGDAVVEIIEALAPLGGPSLKIIETFAKVIGAVADSDLGTPILAAVAAYSALNRTLAITVALQTRLGVARGGASAAGLAANAAAASGLAANAAASNKAAAAAASTSKTTTALGGLTTAAGRVIPVLGAVSLGMIAADAATEGFGDRIKQVQDNIDTGKFKEAADELDKLKAQAKDSNEVSGLGDGLSDIGKGLGRVATGDFGFLFGKDEEKIRKMEAALKDAEKAAAKAAADQNAFDQVAEKYGNAGEKADAAARATDRLKNSMLGLDAVVSRQGAWDAYQAAIDGMTDSVAENGRTLNANTAAGRANRENLRQIASSAQDVAEKMSSNRRATFLENALKQFDIAVEKAGGATAATNELREELNNARAAAKFDIAVDPKTLEAAREKTRALKGEFGDLDGKVAKPTLDLYEDLFGSKYRNALNDLNSFDGVTAEPDADLNIGPLKKNTSTAISLMDGVTRNGPSPTAVLLGVPAFNSTLGNMIRPRSVAVTPYLTVTSLVLGVAASAKKAAGGTTVPDDGGGYRDYLLYRLAPKEEVTTNRNGEADRFRPELKDINAGMSRAEVYNRMALRGLADGGTVAGGLASGGTVRSLPFAGLDGFNLASASARELARELGRSKSALAAERSQRERATELRSTVATGLQSELYGGGEGAFEDALGGLKYDIKAARVLRGDVKTLKGKKFNGTALEGLLAEGSPDAVASFAGRSRAELAEFERLIKVRQSVTRSVGADAAVAAFGSQKQTVHAIKALTARVEKFERAMRSEGAKSRASRKSSAASAARGRNRGGVPR